MKTIGVAVIGASPINPGWAMRAHIPALQALPDYELRAVGTNQTESAQAAAKTFGVPAFANIQDLIAYPGTDLVVVTVKVQHHHALISAALNAGKMVFCEWPLGRNLAEAVDLAALAKARGARTVIGLQSRATPAVNYVKDLISDGYLGEVLSVSVVGSGIFWGATLPAVSIYTLARENGAGMINVSFAHGLDSICYMIGSKISEVTAVLANRRNSVEIIETKETFPMTTPDQIIVGGKLENGTMVSVHYRGGLSRGANFRCEINGTRGDLVITSSLGYPGVGDVEIHGGHDGDAQVHNLPIPSKYILGNAPGGVAHAVFYNYLRLAHDLEAGTHFSANFDDAVQLHRVVDAIETSAKNRSIVTIANAGPAGLALNHTMAAQSQG